MKNKSESIWTVKTFISFKDSTEDIIPGTVYFPPKKMPEFYKKNRYAKLQSKHGKIYRRIQGFPLGSTDSHDTVLVDKIGAIELLGGYKEDKSTNIFVKKSWWLPYFFNYPELTDKVSFRISIISFVLGLISLIFGVLGYLK